MLPGLHFLLCIEAVSEGMQEDFYQRRQQACEPSTWGSDGTEKQFPGVFENVLPQLACEPNGFIQQAFIAFPLP